MEAVDRRLFLRRASVAAVGVAGAQGIGADAAQALVHRSETDDAIEPASDRVVAFVNAGSRNEVTVLVGEHEYVCRDPRLARLLLRAAR